MTIHESPSARLRAKLELATPVLRATAAQLWAGPRMREIYPVYLATMHMVVRSTVPLLSLARAHARDRARTDHLCAQLAEFFARRIEAESGDDERLLDDLAATGADPQLPLAAIPSPKIANLVGAQYYWVQHHHPIALLGHLGAIASYPPPLGFAARIQARTGFPAAAFRVIRERERSDPWRAAEFDALLDELPIGPRQETLIGLSALHSVATSVEVLDDIHERVTARP